MAADRAQGARLLRWLRRLVLVTGGLRHAWTLFRLGLANARTLGAYERACRRIAGRPVRARGLGSLWLPLRRHASLFRPYPAVEDAEDARERERLARVRGEAEKLAASHPPAVDPVSAPSALQLNVALVRRAFVRLFDLRLAADEAVVLARYGSAGLVARDFLEYCGYGAGARAAAPLALQLPGFVIHAELRHSRTAARGRRLELGWPGEGGLAALWTRLHRFVCRVYWSRGDARERLERMAARVEAHRQARLEVIRAMKQRVDPSAQASVLAVLADHMHLRAALVLAELCEELRRTLTQHGGGTIERLGRHEFEFLRATHGLEENLRAALGR